MSIRGKRIIRNLLTMIVDFIAVVSVLHYGWGMQPQSWWWIIGVGFFARLANQIITPKYKNEE